ncbi:MAG: LysM peptidoglycan-binding domain-containing protein [Syntrophales bacterium]
MPWLLSPVILSFLLTIFTAVQSVAANVSEGSTGIAPIALSTPLVAEEAAGKKPEINSSTVKQDNKQGDLPATATSKKNTEELELEQDIMEKALELVNESQKSWVKGDIEEALGALDDAYAILLETDGDADIVRQKDDLRLLISKKILSIYTSRQTVTKGRRSEVPLVMNSEVEREIRSFQTVEREYFLNSYQRSAFFRPAVLAALKQAGLPEELSWLPLVESGFKVRALSSARALGMWQFIPSTGYKYGLSRDEWIDERMDVEKSTQAAIGYMKDLHDMFGDWLTVLAAYNCGEGRMMRVISGQHIEYLDRFWDLYKKLPKETARYVPRFLATLHIIKDPQKYGFNLEVPLESRPTYAYDTVKITRTMNLCDIASSLGVSDEQLAILNAELRLNKTPDREYGLKLPTAFLDKFAQVKDEIPLAEKPRQSETKRLATLRYKVKRGETLSSIARRYGTTPNAIRKENRFLGRRNVKAGQRLVIVLRGAKLAKITEHSTEKSVAANSQFSYKVKKGDTLHSLARSFDTSIAEIKKNNNIKGSLLRIGQKLKLDKKASAENASGKKA